ncbi:hypothetical protein [Streptomyces sp. NPDC007346]|uniref:hypothetical protein n=1 Tax=Streptomyces sp. NPDC007346 TaxID=3154682 RepID=UPI00345609D5
MDQTTAAAVFAAAATATSWTRTHLGAQTEVSHGLYAWTVRLPPECGNAYIVGRHGYGGSEDIHAEATPLQTIGIVEAALNAFRPRTAPLTAPIGDNLMRNHALTCVYAVAPTLDRATELFHEHMSGATLTEIHFTYGPARDAAILTGSKTWAIQLRVEQVKTCSTCFRDLLLCEDCPGCGACTGGACTECDGPDTPEFHED